MRFWPLTLAALLILPPGCGDKGDPADDGDASARGGAGAEGENGTAGETGTVVGPKAEWDPDAIDDPDAGAESIDDWVFETSAELTFDESGLAKTFVLGDVDLLGESESSGFYLVHTDEGGTETETHLSKLSQSGDEITVALPDDSVSFDLLVEGWGHHVAIHLLGMDGVPSRAHSLRLRLSSNASVKTHTLSDMMTASARRTNSEHTINWPYLWGRARPDGTYGSIALYDGTRTGDDMDESLAEIWAVQGTLGRMVHPAAQPRWTRALVRAWADHWAERFGAISKVSIDADTPEELYEITDDYVVPLGANRVYMFSSVWRKGEGLTAVHPVLFPGGVDDLMAYEQYLREKGIDLQLKSLSPQVNQNHTQYFGADFVDPRMMRWGEGTLVGGVSDSDTTVQVSIDELIIWNSSFHKYMVVQVGNELIRAAKENVTPTVDGTSPATNTTYTLTNVERGFGVTEPAAHTTGSAVVANVYINGNFNFEDDFGQPNSLAEEICYPYGDFLNEVHTGHIHFDGTGRMQQLPWYVRDFTDAVYSRIDHAVTTSRVGGQIPASFERYFSKAQAVSGSWGYSDLPIRPRLHEEGRDHTELAASVMDFHFDIADHLLRGSTRVSLIGGQSGSALSLATLEGFGMTEEALELFGYWMDLAPVLDEADVSYVAGFLTKNGSHYYTSDIPVLSKNGDGEYIFTPYRVMNRPGDDNNGDGTVDVYDFTHMDQEWGTKPYFHEVALGSSTEFNNPYAAQSPQVLIFIESESSPLSDPTISVAGAGSLSITGDVAPNQYLKYEGGSSATLYDENWNEVDSLPASASSFTVAGDGNSTVSITADSGSNIKLQLITLGPEHVLETNKHL